MGIENLAKQKRGRIRFPLICLWVVALGVFEFLILAPPVLAGPRIPSLLMENDCANLGAALSNPENLNATHLVCIGRRILALFGLVLPGVVAVFMLLYSGLLYITSQGKPDVLRKATDTAIYAVVGLGIVALAAVIVHFTGLLIGADFGV